MSDSELAEKPEKLYVAWLGGHQWHGNGIDLYGLPSYDHVEMYVLRNSDQLKGIGVFEQSDDGIGIVGFDGKWKPSQIIDVPPDTLKSPGIAQGGGSIVRGLDFWRRGNKFYWEDGEITDVHHAAEGITMMINPYSASNRDFSKWSKKTRAKVKARWDDERRQAKDAEEKEERERLALVEIAKDKITEEEFSAIYDTGYREGRGF